MPTFVGQTKLEFSTKISVSVSGKLNKSIPFVEGVGVSPCLGVFIEITPSFVFKADAKISVDATLTGTIGFAYDTKTRFNNLTTTKLVSEITIEGTIFLGLSLEPKIKILSDKIAKTSVIAQVGGEIKASYKKEIAGINTPESQHLCKNCLVGEAYAKLEGSFSISLANGKWKPEIKLLDKKIKLFDFYYSFDFKEFGFGTCPHQKGSNPEYEGEIIDSGSCGANGDNVKYELYENGTLRIFGEGDMDDYDEDGYFTPYNISNIKKVVIENGVTSIGSNAFPDCKSLESVVISDSVINIGMFAFAFCENLKSVIISNNVTSICLYAFYGCTSLESITIPNSVIFMDNAFYGCSNLDDVYYIGTEEEWEEIDIDDRYFFTRVSIHFNSTGTASTYKGKIIDSGSCGANGDNVKYELYENRTLRIFGEGDMYDNIDGGSFIANDDNIKGTSKNLLKSKWKGGIIKV